MTKDDYMPLTPLMAPPDTLGEAEQRCAKYGDPSLTGLIGCVFLDHDQFGKAMCEFGWVTHSTLICDGGRVKTYKVTCENPSGTSYLLVLNEVGMSHCQVVNCKLSKAGRDIDPADLNAFKDVMEPDFPSRS